MNPDQFAVTEASVEALGEALESCDGGCRNGVRHLCRLPYYHQSCRECYVDVGGEVVRCLVAKDGEHKCPKMCQYQCLTLNSLEDVRNAKPERHNDDDLAF